MATKILLMATPFFYLLILIELFFNKKSSRDVYRINDSVTSLSLGVISQTKRLVIFSAGGIVYSWVAETLAVTQMPIESGLVWVFSFIFYDFLYYWYHRFSHQINFLWASHVVHHQSEEYNLTTALRQTGSSVMTWVFYIPAFIIGIPAEVFFVSGALNLIYQFWVHTQLVGKLGWYESIFVTPSHHRVHHAQNSIYIDKNHGGVFILWDRFFGTFQEELDDEKVIYGVRRPVKSFNPVWANVHTWYSLLIDAIRTKRWVDKLRIWFMPTGWRPVDVEQKFPLVKQPAGQQIKYNPGSTSPSKYYALFQFFIGFFLGVIFILYGRQFDFSMQLLFFVLITFPLMVNGFILEGRSFVRMVEVLRLLITSMVVFYFRDVFSATFTMMMMGYFLLSFVGVIFIGGESLKQQEAT